MNRRAVTIAGRTLWFVLSDNDSFRLTRSPSIEVTVQLLNSVGGTWRYATVKTYADSSIPSDFIRFQRSPRR